VASAAEKAGSIRICYEASTVFDAKMDGVT
jgi:hypothetical protein